MNNHCYGGRVESCPFYETWFDFEQIPYWRSVGARSDVEEQIDNFQQSLPVPSDEMVSCLVDVLSYLDQFFDKPLRPLSDEAAAQCLPSDTSPGFPYAVTRPGVKKGELRTEIKADVAALNFKRGFKFTEPCMAGLRLALARKPKNKPRVVWIVPSTVQLCEAKYFVPVYQRLFKNRLFSWDFSFLRGEIGEINTFMSGCPLSYGTDVSTFDATVSKELIGIIFKWMKSKFVMTGRQCNVFDAVENYFVNTPLWYKQNVFLKKHGVPSGSFFTQLIDSIINLGYQLYLVRKAKGNVSGTGYDSGFKFTDFSFLRVLGDDALVGFDDDYFDLGDFTTACGQLNALGIKIHPSKGYFRGRPTIRHEYKDVEIPPRIPEFLGFQMPSIFSNRRIPVLYKDPELVVAQCLFPESKEKHPGIALARLIGIKWSSGDSPEAHDAVDYFHSLFEERHKDASPHDLPPEFRHLFQFVFGRIHIPVDKYPTTAEVMKRYRTPIPSTANDKLPYFGGTYFEWVKLSWQPILFSRAKTIIKD